MTKASAFFKQRDWICSCDPICSYETLAHLVSLTFLIGYNLKNSLQVKMVKGSLSEMQNKEKGTLLVFKHVFMSVPFSINLR